LLWPNQAITVRAAPLITTKRCHSHALKTHKKQARTDPQSGTTPVRSLQGYRFTVPKNRRWPQLKSSKPKNETKFRSYSLTLHRIHVKLPGQLHILPLCPGGGDKNKYKTISMYVQIKVISREEIHMDKGNLGLACENLSDSLRASLDKQAPKRPRTVDLPTGGTMTAGTKKQLHTQGKMCTSSPNLYCNEGKEEQTRRIQKLNLCCQEKLMAEIY
jgi:hypothetical protein